jgi:methylamine dehydrogenase accessory protein MauD
MTLSELSQLVLWIMVLLLSAVTFALVRQVGLIHQRIPPTGARMLNVGPPVGSEVPSFDELSIDGKPTTLAASGRKTLLVFVSSQCDSCAELAPALKSFARSERARLDTILIARSSVPEMREFSRENRLEGVPIIASMELVEKFQVNNTPYGLLVSEDGILITKGIVNTLEHLTSMAHAAELEVDSLETLIEREHEHHHPLPIVPASGSAASS